MSRYTKGFTLIELSISLVVIGVIVGIVAQLYPKVLEKSNIEKVEFINEIADQTIVSYLAVNGRLPCPATDGLGNQNCAVKQGDLPFRTLGLGGQLHNEAGLPLAYALYSQINPTATLDTQLEVLKDRYAPYIATDDNAVGVVPVGNSTILNTGSPNGLDTCQALKTASSLVGVAVTNLYVDTGVLTEHVAYVLHDSGTSDADGINGLADGINNNNPLQFDFDSSTVVAGASNDDRVTVKTFNQLWAELGCASIMVAAGHGHPNAASSTAILNQSMADYQVQIGLVRDIAAADVAASVASILAGIGATAAAAATIPIATSEALNTSGAMAPVAALAVAAVSAAVISTVVAGATTALAAVNLANADTLVADVATMVGEINTLNVSVLQNATDADAAGLYQK